MQWAVIIIGGLLMISIGVAIVFARSHTTLSGPAAVLYAPVVATTSNSVMVTPTSGTGPLAIDGEAIMDESTGVPAVPYIKYFENDGDLATKQLIFADARGCLPGAGDLPCVPSYPAQSAYPQLKTGQHIHVEGYIRENRFLVTQIALNS